MPAREIFSSHLDAILGPQWRDDYKGPDAHVLGKFPPHVYRVMSDEEYKIGMRQGYFKSNESNNWRAQSAGMPDSDNIPQEGTVGGIYAFYNYLPKDGSPGRIVKFDSSVGGWEIHPHVPEGDYMRTLEKIPANSIRAVSPPIIRGGMWGDQLFTYE